MPNSFLYFPPPPVVVQSSNFACWAAALQGWLKVTPNRKAMHQYELLALLEEKGAVDEEGGLRVKKGILFISQQFNMQMGVFPKWKKSQVTGAYLLQKMVKNGYLYFSFNEKGIGHAVVVWGIVREPGGSRLFAMDPWPGNGQTEEKLASYLTRGSEFIIGWAREGLKQSPW